MSIMLVAARTIIRFSVVVLVAATLISLTGRCVSDFDLPPSDDPRDWWRGLGIWLLSGTIAILNEIRLARRRKEIKQ